jgi:hypothetical protein
VTLLSDDMQSVLPSLITSITAGLIAALVSVRLALRRFRSEKWWERKASVYSELFESLFHVKTYTEHLLQKIEEGAQFSEERMKELGGRSRAGRDGIRRAAVIGTFILNDEAAARLAKLVSDLDDPKHGLDLPEEIAADRDLVIEAIDDLRPIAKRDLSV